MGSQYAFAFVDAKGDPLDGGKTYKIHLPPNIPVKTFWPFVVYDNQTGSMLQTDEQFLSIGSQKKGIVINREASLAEPCLQRCQKIPGKIQSPVDELG